jgi:hypothetical protein
MPILPLRIKPTDAQHAFRVQAFVGILLNHSLILGAQRQPDGSVVVNWDYQGQSTPEIEAELAADRLKVQQLATRFSGIETEEAH